MSTKAIRALIEDAGCRDDSQRYERIQAALAEIEAIERASKVISKCSWDVPRGVTVEDVQQASDLVNAIAEESE